eukprot:GFYU01001710.1.p1 GENE.GFYU01001710.1~~GFYU01001710.1.p1  ORF type:complete len:837 (-),score=324.28 GFYU01001710.1:210-2720(-)
MSHKPKRNDECVRVVVRCRPLSKKEVEDNRNRVVDMDTGVGSISVRNPKADMKEPPKTFTFDSVYDWNSTQRQIYDETARPIVESVMEGYNGTIFAYGQTGTGKTHTMEGKDDPPDLRGIIPNAFQHIFEAIAMAEQKEFLVRASFLEIYMEEIRDLLSKDYKAKLELKEDVDRGVYVKGLTSFVVKGVSEIDKVMQVGKKNRTVGATLMNVDSSRSHSIFTITIETSERGPDGQSHIRVGKLNMVDLAGSERQSKTGATGQRLQEATKINLSLSALGNVISALVESKTTHIPYRDSKLTRLLQDSLGGNTKTVMVTNIGPADYNYDETLSSLRYANRAKNIKNKPRINEDPKDTMLREYQEEIAKLRAKLSQVEEGGGGGGGHTVETVIKEVEVVKEVRVEVPVEVQVPVGCERIVGEDGEVQYRTRDGRDVIVQEDDQGQAVYVTADGEQLETQGSMPVSNEQLAEMEEKMQAEKEALLQQKDMVEEEKQRIAEEFDKQLAVLEEERAQRENLANELKKMEEKLIVGGESIIDKAAWQENEIRRKEAELEDQKRKERQLAVELQEAREAQMMEQEQFSSLQEEVEVKTKKLKKLWQHYQAAKTEARDLQAEFQQEREDMLDTIRELNSQMKLKQLIIDSFVPPEEQAKIERRAHYDEEGDEWIVDRIEFAGNHVRQRRPTSAVGLKRPTSEFARTQQALGDDNPRYKYENIINLELDMPERTTHDYDGIASNPAVQAAINAALQPDDEELTFQGGRHGGGYVMEESSRSSRKARPQSGRRPHTPSKKGNRSSRRPDSNVGDISDLQAMDDNGQQEQYPQARGLLSARGRRGNES